MKRVVLVLLLLTATMTAGVAGVDAQSAEPTFRVENPRLDLGEIKAGSEVVATFVFHNDGPDDVKILRAKPS